MGKKRIDIIGEFNKEANFEIPSITENFDKLMKGTMEITEPFTGKGKGGLVRSLIRFFTDL